MVFVNGPAGDQHGLTGDWATYRGLAFHIIFASFLGPNMRLGRLKLKLPNRFSGYLHEPAGRNWFERKNDFLARLHPGQETGPSHQKSWAKSTKAPSLGNLKTGNPIFLLKTVPVNLL